MSDIEDQEYKAAAERLFNGDESPLDNPLFGLGMEFLSEFNQAEQQRRETEERWLKDLRQYKGIYDPDVEENIEGSKAFLRKTRVKVESVDARLMDLLFPANKDKNWSVDATPEPTIPPSQKKRLVALLTEGNGGLAPDQETINSACIDFAKTAATGMSQKIEDQLAESRYRDIARKVLHSGNLYGTGVLKGPLVERKTRVTYCFDEETSSWKQSAASFVAPFVAYVPIWRFYPDMSVTDLEDAQFVWEHHRLSRAKLAELVDNKSFHGERIKQYILANSDGATEIRSYEQALRSMGESRKISYSDKYSNQYDVFERWGWITGEKLRACGVDVPDERLYETFFSNLWLLPNGEVIRAVLSPIEGINWPYHIYYFDKDETSIFGEGLASIMRDDQEMINAAIRMLLDNASVTAGPNIEVYTPAFPANANVTEVHSRKVWLRTEGDMQYPAVRQINFDSHIAELSAILDLFDRNADETTAIPKFTYGDNPTRGAAGTMGGLSMLLGQANIALKDLVVSWDEGVTKPFIKGMYSWNMRFTKDDMIKGDFEVLAKGASSLIAKEVKSNTLSQFGATLQPEERPYINWEKLVREKASAMDIGDMTKTQEEVDQENSSPMAQMQQQMQQVTQELQIALAKAQVAEIQARATKLESEAMNKKIEGVYAAMQAAGVASQSPSVAAGGDAILQSAGYTDATPGDPVTGFGQDGAQVDQSQIQEIAQQGEVQHVDNTQPQEPNSPFVGGRAGIQTPEIADGIV